MNEETLFTAALAKKTPEERAAFLGDACGADVMLRSRVEALLRSHEMAGNFLKLGDTCSAGAGPRKSACAELEKPSMHIGPYKLLQKLGEGGMGTVWLAEQNHPVRRQVALKVIKAGMDSARVLARFDAERQALALMDHPNIARVLDAGTMPGVRGEESGVRDQESDVRDRETGVSGQESTPDASWPYFVMELVKGLPITKYCEQEHLSARERLELFVPVCHAVQHAHMKGIIHRDLKPSNVLIALYDGKPVPKVIDFGVAKATSQKLTDETMFTEVGQIVGTLEYMAPEQVELNNLDIDTRADIYSLGVLLYELLTGSPPFTKEQLRGQAFTQMLRIIREVEPPKPSTKISESAELPAVAAHRKMELRKMTRLVHGDLDWIVMKCLEKERRRRYETASGLALDIQRFLSSEPVAAGPPSAAYRMRKFFARNRGPVLAAALLLLALIGGIIGTSIGLVEARAERDEKELARQEAEKNEKWALAAAEREREATASESLAKRKAESAAAAEHEATKQAETAAEAERRAKEEAQKAATAERRAKEIAQSRLAQIENAVSVLGSIFKDLNPRAESNDRKPLSALLGERLDWAAKELSGDIIADPVTAAKLQRILGHSLAELGYHAKAIALLVEARERFETHLGPDHLETLLCMNDLGGTYFQAGQYVRSLDLLEEAWRRQQESLPDGHPETLATMGNLALAYKANGQLAKATPLLETVLARMKATVGVEHPNTLLCMSNLATIYHSAKQIAKALPLYEETLALQEKYLSPDHADTLTTMMNLAMVYQDAGRITKAVTLMELHLEKTMAKLGADHPDTLVSMNNLAMAYHAAGRLDKAVPLLERTLEKSRSKHGLDHRYTLTTLRSLALILQETGKCAKAEPFFRELLAQARKDYEQKAQPSEHLVVAWKLDELGQNLLKQKKYADAEPALRESFGIHEKHGPDHWTTFNTRSMLGEALVGLKTYADAEEFLVRGYRGMKERSDRIPAEAAHSVLVEAVERLAWLYQAWGKSEEAARWTKELASIALRRPAGVVEREPR